MKALSPPDEALQTENAVEVIRGWIVEGDLQVSLAFEAFGNDPEIWGQLLAETAVHLADAMSIERYGKREEIFSRIRASLLDHLENPFSGLHGSVLPPTQ